MSKRGFSYPAFVLLALCLSLSSPSVILQAQEGLLLLGICCVLILPVFAVGMAVLQDKLPT